MNIMVTPPKDTDISNTQKYGKDFEFFLEHREEFITFMELEDDVVRSAFKLQELLFDDGDPGGNKFWERFTDHKTAGFTLIKNMSHVMEHNILNKNEEGAVKVLEHLFLLSFLGLSRIEDRGLVKKEKIKQLNLDGSLSTSDDEEEKPLIPPNISKLTEDDCIFHVVFEDGNRIEIYPTSIEYYTADTGRNLGNLWIAGCPELDDHLEETVKVLRYTKNKILALGSYTVDEMKSCQVLIKSVNEEEKAMATVTVKINDPIEFLRNPQIYLNREDYVEKHGEVPGELIINARYLMPNNIYFTLGRWSMNKIESDTWTLRFRPVNKTKKKLVSMIRKCFDNLGFNDANTAFSYYLNKERSAASKFINNNNPETVNLPEHIEEGKRTTESFEVDFYNSSTQQFDTLKMVRINARVTESGKIIVFSDTHNNDWKQCLSLGNRLVRLRQKPSTYEIEGTKNFSNKEILKVILKGVEDPKEGKHEKWFRTSLFDEGIIFNPADPENDEFLTPINYGFKDLVVTVDETNFYPNDNFKFHEVSDNKDNLFLAFCGDNLQNFSKKLDHEDFLEEVDQANHIAITRNGKTVGSFEEEIYQVGDYVFLFSGDKESLVFKEALYHMSMYEQVYYLFKSTSPYRKGKLGTDKTISYSDLKRKGTSTAPQKVLVRPPKRKANKITF
jgi:hypothetical protein